MKKTIFRMAMLAAAMFTATTMTSCLNSDEETIVLESPSTGIPDDSQATANPVVTNTTTYVPNIQTTLDNVNGMAIIRIDMTGVKNPDGTEWLKLYGTGSSNQNIWVEVDGKPKGIDVYNNSDNDKGKSIKTDIIFTVDNSGSMSEEADAIARDIVSWAKLLTNSGLDVRFGVVGYGGYIDGAINLTSVNELSEYLNASTGINRTMQFSGKDANNLSSYASSFKRTSNSISDQECGAMAIQFADKYFSFRSGANRIYVNFTDEPNQPKGNQAYSVLFFEDQDNWPASKGTVHTVYSDTKVSNNNWYYSEQPWLISEYTGGTTIFAPANFSGVTLESLPVTGAMENSYIIRFANINDLLDGKPHLVHITIRSKDGSIVADKTFSVIFGNS